MVRLFLAAAVFLAAAACERPSAPTATAPAPKQFLNDPTEARPRGYTHVVVTPPGRTIYLSGAGGRNDDGSMPPDIEAQTENTFRSLERRLAMAGATFHDVVKINYFVANMAHMTAVREVRARYLDMDNPPAATAVQAGLGGTLLLEVEAIAVVPE